MINLTEQKNNYSISNILLILSIALLTACFTSKSYDLLGNYQEITNIDCGQGYLNSPKILTTVSTEMTESEIISKNNEMQIEMNNCYDNKNKMEKNYTNTKTSIMLVIGFVYLVIGVLLSKKINSTSPNGISLGGFFLIIYYLILNWFNFSQLYQVIIMGCLLIAMIFFGINKFNFE